MRVSLDTDVLLDVALAREPHVTASVKVLRWAERKGEAAVAWHSLTNCATLLQGSGREFLQQLLQIVTVATSVRHIRHRRRQARFVTSDERCGGRLSGISSIGVGCRFYHHSRSGKLPVFTRGGTVALCFS